jgi:predicted ester cyclase
MLQQAERVLPTTRVVLSLACTNLNGAFTMSPSDVVTAFAAAINAHDLDTAATLMTDDFSATGLAPVPLTREMFLASQQAWYAGCPDWAVTLGELSEHGDTVTGRSTMTATHTGSLSLPGAPTLPPTGKRLSGVDDVTLTIRDGRIAAFALVEDTSVAPPLAQQLGIA